MKTTPGRKILRPSPDSEYGCFKCKASPRDTVQAYVGYFQLCDDRKACHRRRVLPRLRVIQGGGQY